MKVAVVCPYDLGIPGGVQDQTARLVRWLGAAGHEAVLVGPGLTGPDGAILVGKTRTVPVNRSAAPVSLDRWSARRVVEGVAGADVVHVHEPFVPIVGAAALRAPARAKVITFHADPSRAIRLSYSLGRALARRLLAGAQVITAVSETAASAVRGIRPVRIVPNGIDLDEYGGGAAVPGRAVFVGRDDPRKGLDVLLAAWPAVVAAVPGATLDVVGAARASAIPGIRFLGTVAAEEKRAALAAAEVMVAPNTGAESFGVVLLEAMASGCAVVASGIPAFAALLAGSGVLVAPGDVDGLAAAIVALLGDDERRRRLAAAGRQRAQAFSGPAIAGRYVDAYREALAEAD